MANCTGQIAASVGLNCDNPLVGGYTGRAVLIPVDYVDINTDSGSNDHVKFSRIGKNIFLYNGIPVGGVYPPIVAVDNVMMINPFDGSQTAGNADDGFVKFTKSFAFRIPDRGGRLSKDLIEPLVLDGRFVALLEKEQQKTYGKIEIVGLHDALKCVDPSTVTRQENANGGAWSVGMQCSEFSAEDSMVSPVSFNDIWDNAL